MQIGTETLKATYDIIDGKSHGVVIAITVFTDGRAAQCDMAGDVNKADIPDLLAEVIEGFKERNNL